ncbi:PepSY domain-containing protein [Longitalea luteola]|uniref:PepSY domain-containing protein n=1 Tax=Longitalea luteola TaxID=2812563 RepID=UPI001A956463|nr:PepSY domain-containing protein [Longitalea luteola]
MLRKKIYFWHRTLSLIIAIPVLLWAASGFMHPLMTNIKPQVAIQKLPPVPVDSQALKVPLRAALDRNNIKTIHDVRLIHIDTNLFYQVQQEVNKAPVYLSANNGKLLPSGDWLYAQYLARQFLEGPSKASSPAPTASPAAMVTEEETSAHDCCNAATACVLNNTTGSRVANVSRLTNFDKEYKYVNRLLPVYKVAFNRPDGVRIYVETTQDRLAFAMDNRRAAFDAAFQFLHTWAWLDAFGNTKLYFIIAICLLSFLTALMGIYIFCISKTKKANGHPIMKARQKHRYTAIVGALFTLCWSFSGAWHALAKFKPDDRLAYFASNRFSPIPDLDFARLQSAVQQPVSNISLVKMNAHSWWRVSLLPANKPTVMHAAVKTMKNREAKLPAVMFVNTNDYSVLPKGEEQYAAWLATQFSKQAAPVQTISPVTKFNEEYNFTDKRLPVWRACFAAPLNEKFFVETSTGRLAAKVDDNDLAEGYSFALLHKHHFMDWAGKAGRDWSTMVWAFFQIIMITIGLMLWWKKH